MGEHWNRRVFLRAGAATGLLLFAAPAACSSHKAQPSSTGGGNGPLTLTHALGETTIAAPPQRGVPPGFTGRDDLRALAIVPVGVPSWFGEEPFGVWPWAQPKLGAAK